MSAESSWNAEETKPWAVLSKKYFLDRASISSRTCVMPTASGCVIRTEMTERSSDDYNGGFRVALVYVPGATWEDFFGNQVPRGAVEWVT